MKFAKKQSIRLILLFLGILSVSLFYGCSQGNVGLEVVSEKDEKHYQRGQRLYKEQRYPESLAAFLKVTEKRKDAAESHLEAGRIYLEHLGDPVAAIYHFRKFLEYKPNVEQSPMVRQMIDTAQKAFVKSLPGKPYNDDMMERVDLMALLKDARDENAQLKKELASFRRTGQANRRTQTTLASNDKDAPTFTPKRQESKIVGAGQLHFYTVEVGDTLSKISSKVYGSGADWERIYTANKDSLRNAHDLKVGQVLKIPK